MMIIAHNHSTLPPDLGGSLADVLRVQEEAGCTVATDGFYSSRDPVWLAIECVDGVHAGAMVDYFGAGFTVPTPVVRDHLHYHGNAAVERWRAAQAETQKPVKAVLPGPLTLAELSDYEKSPYSDRAALAEAWATALLPEFTALVQAGAPWIQLDEPAILRRPGAIRLLRDLLQPFWESRESARLLVSTWGPNAAAMYAQLHSLPADVVGVDLATDPDLVDLIAEVGASQELYLGLVGAYDEGIEQSGLQFRLEKLLHNYEFAQLHLGPACGLARLSPQTATTALRHIAAVAEKLSAISASFLP